MIGQPEKIEFTVASAIQPLVDLFCEIIDQTNFRVEPYRWVKDRQDHKKFHIFLADQDRNRQLECGWVEFNGTKAGLTRVRLDPTNDASSYDRPDRSPLARLFYLFVQRMVQLGMVAAA